MKNLKENDIVYFLPHLTYGDVIQGKVTQIIKGNVAKIHCFYGIDKDGRIISNENECTKLVNTSMIFSSPTDAYTLRNKIKDNCIKGYCQNIKTVKDLICFPLKHRLSGEEYTDDNAIEAYKIRAKELLGIEL